MRKLTAFMALLALGWAASLPARADGRVIGSAIGEEAIQLWDTASGAALRSIEVQEKIFFVAFSPVGRTNASWSPGGIRLWDASSGNAIRLWDIANGRFESAFKVDRGAARSIVYSPDGRILASIATDGSIELRDAASGGPRATFFVSGDKRVAYTPDGLFVPDADPRAAFQIVRGTELLQMDDFVALNRRDSLFGSAPDAGASK